MHKSISWQPDARACWHTSAWTSFTRFQHLRPSLAELFKQGFLCFLLIFNFFISRSAIIVSGRGTCLGGQSKRNSLAVTEVIDSCHLNAITAGNLTGQSRHSIYLTVWLIPLVHVMTSRPVTSPFFAHSLLWVKADTCFEVWVSSFHSQDQHGWFFSRQCKWYYTHYVAPWSQL